MCTTVAFAERMRSVDLTQVMRRALAECRCLQSDEMVFLGQLFEDGLGSGFEVDMMGKEAVALGYIDVPKLAGPVVHVTEKMAVNGAQVRQVEASLDRMLSKYDSCIRYFRQC